MSVFVLIGGWSYEGFDEPIGVYSTMELAEEAKKKNHRGYDFIEILEHKIDHATDS